MGFHDVRLPETFSVGSLFGPGFQTKVIELDSLAEHRVQRGPVAGRRRYALEKSIANLDALYVLYEFFLARQGSLNSFRLKDWLDYATTSTGTVHRPGDSAVAYGDQDLVLVSGFTYQFVKRYVSGSQIIVRTLRKLVSGTVKVGDGTGERTTGFSLDLQNGQVTFTSAPTGQVTGGCEFDVPVRFAEETDRSFMVAIDALDVGNLGSILCIEDVDPVVVSQDFHFGGAKNHGDPGADHNLSELDGRVQVFDSSIARSVLLPPTVNLPLGGPYFHLVNDGSATITLKDSDATTITTITSGAAKTVWLGVDDPASAKTWYVV